MLRSEKSRHKYFSMRKDQRLVRVPGLHIFLCHFTACTFAAAAASLVNFGPHDLSCPKFVPWCQISAFHPRSNSLSLLLKYEGDDDDDETLLLYFTRKRKDREKCMPFFLEMW